METRANYVAIGIFVLVVLAGAFGSLWWLYRASGTGATERLRIIFPEAVTGLSTGAGVYFNGIRVGEVTSLEFPPEGGDNVIAITRVNPSAPIKVNTQAQLASQGLTGVAYVSLVGGSGESLFEAADKEDKIPTLEAATSAFTNVLDTLQSVLGRLDSTLGVVRQLVDENQGNLSGVVQNVRTITDNLAQASPQVPGMVTDFSNAANAIAQAAPQITGVVENANGILAAIDPSRVGTIVGNIETFSGDLPKIGQQADTLMASANGIVTRVGDAADTLNEALNSADTLVKSIDATAVNQIITNVDTVSKAVSDRSSEIGSLIDNASRISVNLTQITDTVAARRDDVGKTLDDVSALVGDIRTAVKAAGPAIQNISRASAAITPEKVTGIVDDVQSVTNTLAGQAENVASLVGAATEAAKGIDSVTRVLSARSEAIGTTIDQASALVTNLRQASDGAPQLVATAEKLLEDASATVAAVDATRIDAVVANVERLSQTVADKGPAIADLIEAARGTAMRAETITSSIAQRMPAIGTAIDDATATMANVRTASNDLPRIVASLEPGIANVTDVLNSIDPAAIEAIVSNVEALSTALGGQAPAVERIVERVEGVVADASSVAADARVVVQEVATRSAEIGTAIDDASAAIASARQAADAAPRLVASLEPGIANLSNVLSAVDPAAIEAIVANVRGVTDAVNAQTPAIDDIVTAVRGASLRVEAITSGVAQRMPRIGTAIDDVTASAADIRRTTEALPGLVASLEPGVQNVSDVLAAIDPTAVEAIFQNVHDISGVLSNRAPAIDGIITSAEQSIQNAREVTDRLVARIPAIEGVIDNVAASVADARVFAASLPDMATALQPGIENVSAALSAIDPAALDGIVDDVRGLTTMLSGESERVQAIIAGVDTTVASARDIAAGLQAKLPQVTTAIDDAGAAVASARTFADALPGYGETLRPGIENVSAVLQAVDPAAIGEIVASVKALTDTLGAAAPQVQHFIATAGVAADDVADITGRVRGELGTISAIIDNANGAVADVKTFTATLPALRRQIDPVVDAVTEVVTAVDPVMVRAIMTNVRDVSLTLSDSRENVQQIISTASEASRRIDQVAAAVSARTDQIGSTIDSVSSFAGNLRDAGPSIDDIVASVKRAADDVAVAVSSIDTSAINTILDNARQVATAIGSRTGEIGTAIDEVVATARRITDSLSNASGEGGMVQDLIDRVKVIAANVEGASNKLGVFMDRANAVLGGEVQTVFAGVNGATASIRDVAAAFAPRAGTIANGLSRFSQSGLDDLRALINQGRSTLRAIESAVSSFDRDPSRVIFGGDSAPRYTPQRR
ncbi:MlaD family protein [Acuticoccus sp. I52.16.1]|uniref:MlaD family protein n=1 Tax=Acuticoccus sp. I52.16.1 TaxID=2928472 RepID=UPI001FD3365B|nr:MlaD family protein [Acuticoccus sp. I52.16.1]UOM34721.1 MlaD family protein [Acuticoccus sp. I52.16.1]